MSCYLPAIRRSYVLTIGLLLLSGWLLACSSTPTAPYEEPEEGLRVLFIGNSHTYWNDLPEIVAALSDAAGEEHPLIYRTVVGGGVSLEDHWYAGTARATIAQGSWDVVVLQQGSSARPENQEHLRTWAQRFADEIRAVGARPALYMVWPAASRPSDFDDVVWSYTQAAKAADAVLLPAGAAWLAAWDRDPSLTLYDEDGLHPSRLGSYLAALTIYGGLYETSPLDLPAALTLRNGEAFDVPAEAAADLRAAAAEVLAAQTPEAPDEPDDPDLE